MRQVIKYEHTPTSAIGIMIYVILIGHIKNEREAELSTIHIQKISSSMEVFAKVQPIVKVKQLKSEESARLE
ncbi:hypothetical protein PCO86_13505 [Pectobacteriaceae bacterium CE70]|nr:hypothetical protein [Brenneria ulupoensis]WJV64231.1 hypothetical protein PCO87_09540 [Pectobacteriaceae bacterium C52]WJV65338.1 hypothetical protein PCO86_13505 [Pectobacteriaceae bacterium CE70]WJY09354.1 hypothetical protein PCO80_13390 [Pectobacteriaceae bacterium C80]